MKLRYAKQSTHDRLSLDLKQLTSPLDCVVAKYYFVYKQK